MGYKWGRCKEVSEESEWNKETSGSIGSFTALRLGKRFKVVNGKWEKEIIK